MIVPLYLVPLLTAASVAPPADRSALRYELEVGDRLVFHTTLRQETEWPDRRQSIRVEWSTHVLVVAEEGDAWLVGFARNRTRAQLLGSVHDGRDTSEKDRAPFAERIARMPERFFDANRIDAHGAPRLSVQAIREWPGEALLETRELPALPSSGKEMAGSLLGMQWTVIEREQCDRLRCVRVEARGKAASRLRYWLDPTTSLPRRIEFSAEYSESPDVRHRQLWTADFVERRREQSLALWLWDPKTRLAVLEALRHADAPYLDPQRLIGLIQGGDRAALRLALSLAYRFGQAPFSAGSLASIAENADPRLSALALRVLDEIAVEGQGSRSTALRPSMQKAPQPFGARVYALTGADTRGWPYIAHVPDEYRGDEPMPLLIHLSGGSGGAYASMLTSRDAMAETGWLMVFPQARGMWWHAGTTAMMETLLATLGRRFNVDWNRVYLAGFSNGASGAFYYATLWPHRFAAVVSMMGAGAHVPGIYRAPAEHAVTVPMLILHGDRDDVVPLKAARATVAALKRVDRDAPVRLRVLRGRGHDVVLDRCDGLALSFLARHVRDPFPRHVRLRLRDLRHPRRFWIEMLAKDGKLAEVEAEVGAANVVRLRCRNVRRLRLLARRELFHDAGPVRVLIGKRKVFEEYLSRIDEHHETFRPTGDPYLDSYSPIEIDLGE